MFKSIMMMKLPFFLKISLASVLCSFINFNSEIYAQVPKIQLVNIKVTPDHDNWLYNLGETVKFEVKAYDINSIEIKDLSIKYKIGPEKMEASTSGETTFADGHARISSKGMDKPGFLRCYVTTNFNGKFYSGTATVGFDPFSIQPVVDKPVDFEDFWNKAKVDASKIPLDTQIRLLTDRCTEKVNVYEVNIQNFRIGSRIYGIVCIPKAAGKYPAILETPSAGIKPYPGDINLAEKGVITFQIGIHGIPVTMDSVIYKNLRAGALDLYANFNLDDRDEFYFKRVYMGCVRAVDYIFTLNKFDGKNIAVKGGSQGGALAIVTAALDPRIKYVSAVHPALCDNMGSLHGRPATWPNMFGSRYRNNNNYQEKINTSKYYDVVNFARILKTPGFYSWGYNDLTCPPTTTFAAYNAIKSPKAFKPFVDTGHWVYPEQTTEVNNWVLKKLNVNY